MNISDKDKEFYPQLGDIEKLCKKYSISIMNVDIDDCTITLKYNDITIVWCFFHNFYKCISLCFDFEYECDDDDKDKYAYEFTAEKVKDLSKKYNIHIIKMDLEKDVFILKYNNIKFQYCSLTNSVRYICLNFSNSEKPHIHSKQFDRESKIDRFNPDLISIVGRGNRNFETRSMPLLNFLSEAYIFNLESSGGCCCSEDYNEYLILIPEKLTLWDLCRNEKVKELIDSGEVKLI